MSTDTERSGVPQREANFAGSPSRHHLTRYTELAAAFLLSFPHLNELTSSEGQCSEENHPEESTVNRLIK